LPLLGHRSQAMPSGEPVRRSHATRLLPLVHRSHPLRLVVPPYRSHSECHSCALMPRPSSLPRSAQPADSAPVATPLLPAATPLLAAPARSPQAAAHLLVAATRLLAAVMHSVAAVVVKRCQRHDG
jgi:hypothetical protein